MSVFWITVIILAYFADPVKSDGVLPVGADGKPLNLDFETGTLKDWTLDGKAFEGQPIQGDTVFARRKDNKSEHQGKYWIGGFEKLQDKPVGTLTSVPFAVTHPWASFLVAGGSTAETCVEVVSMPENEVIYRASGLEVENLRRVWVDLAKSKGKQVFVRVIDKSTGPWGHINFDDFRFHAEKSAVVVVDEKPILPNAQGQPSLGLKVDDYKYAGLPPEEAAKAMTVPPGFKVTLFAGEPDVHQPIAFCFDDRGRMWVVEAYTYPKRNPEKGPVLADKKLGDKILIFEDTDGDGKFDKKTVFFEGLNLVSGIELGFGGVWVGAAPYLLFIPVDKSGDKPAGEPKILLDGFGYQDTHETLNSFTWGPDGWLYGCHGVFTHSKVGKPGTADADRTPINAGVWRYHPMKQVFEVYAHGTSNPWGLDYNENGEFFVEACVIPHMWHIVRGGRYQRQAGQHFNPHTYIDIPTIAMHRHYVGATPHGGNNKSDSVGGGHAHSGLLCYQGGLWPKDYHGKLFMGNIHGHRINVDQLGPGQDGYRAFGNPDFLKSHDRYCIIVAMHAGPDGNVYFSDWSDKQVCHRNEVEIWDRTNGRLFKIVHKDTKPVNGLDLNKCTDAELVEHQLNDNDWYARHARRILHERHAAGTLFNKVETREQLAEIAFRHKDDTRRLRALWALHVTGGLTDEMYTKALVHGTTVPVWAIRLGTETVKVAAPVRQALLDKNRPSEWSALFQQARVAALQQMPVADRWEALARFNGFTADQPAQLALYWYAIEPLAVLDLTRLLKVNVVSGTTELRRLAIRRAVDADPMEAVAQVVALMNIEKTSYNYVLSLPADLNLALQSRGRLPAPAEWKAARESLMKLTSQPRADNKRVRGDILRLGLRFGDESAFGELRDSVLDAANPIDQRKLSLESLQEAKDPNLPAVFRKLLADDELRSHAIRGLAGYDDPATVAALLKAYPKFSVAEKRDVVNTLASRVSYASGLLDAIGTKQIPSTDVPAETIRQLRNLGVKAIDDKIAAVWGTVRDTPADRKKLIVDWTRKLNAPQQVDLGAGRAVFNKVCQQCHTLYGVGAKTGPEITGANRSDLGYLLENIFDPSALIPKEYAATKLDLVDGRVLTGIVKEETKTTLTVITATETLTVPVADVDKRTPSPLSMMPDDLTKQLSEPDLRNLIAYLRYPSQVPMLLTKENSKDFFNGKDLTNWEGDKAVWSVENGEIVGKTEKGLKRNNFLMSTFDAMDFRLKLKVKLTPDAANSGIQFRSVPIKGGEMRGPQADIGAGWWGKLYEEQARGLLAKEGGEQFVKPGEWNDYEIEAIGGKVRILINGKECTNYGPDEKLSRRGRIAVQVHSGGPTDVRFKEIVVEVLK